MAIKQFFNLQKEKIDNNLKIIINKIFKVYNIDNKTYKINKKNIIIFNIGYFKIIKIFQKFYLYNK